ncbi:MAG: caspase family protein [Leadbetterella sp.]|nr:caspase family protein [Leadbetterella sp.]
MEKTPIGINHFIGIGIDTYVNCPNLHNCVLDISAIIELLQNKYGFLPKNIKTIYNKECTKTNIFNTLKSYVEKLSLDDNLIIFISGHGYYEKSIDEGYFIPHDVGFKDYLSLGVSNTELLRFVRNIKSRHIFLIMDSCFSGSLFGDARAGLDRYKYLPSRWALTSGRRDEKVSDGVPGKHSPFAFSLLNFLTHVEISEIRVTELIDHVKHNVDGQMPDGRRLANVGDDGGEFVLYNSNFVKKTSDRKESSTESKSLTKKELDELYAKGLNFFKGISGKKDYKLAFEYFIKAARSGHPDSQVKIGFMYEQGLSVERDVHEAFNWYKRAADRNSGHGLFSLSYMYLQGYAVPKDKFESERLLIKSADTNFPDALMVLGRHYCGLENSTEKSSIKIDYGKGIDMLKRVIDMDNKSAMLKSMTSLAIIYEEGRGVESDIIKANSWRKKAADQGDAYSQAYIAELYRFGKGGFNKDQKKAFEYYSKSAEMKCAEGLAGLSDLYFEGEYVQKNYEKAFQLCLESAKLGSTMGMNNVGWMYELGYGVQRNLDSAKFWYSKAIQKGSHKAMGNLKRLDDSEKGPFDFFKHIFK